MRGEYLENTLKTRHRLFEWLVMPFGLCNAPSNFMRLMNDILRPFLDDFVVVYLDDILIFNPSWEAHIQHVRLVFTALAENQLLLNRKKCIFGQTSLIYLGFIAGNGTLQVDLDKVEVIKNWPRPQSVHEVRNFIRNFSVFAAPLHAYTKANQEFLGQGT